MLNRSLFSILLLTGLSVILGCGTGQGNTGGKDTIRVKERTGAKKLNTDTIPTDSLGKVELEEYFVDSVNVGRGGLNKVELTRYKCSDEHYVVIKFYTRTGRKWTVQNEFSFQKDPFAGCDMQIVDMNGDKLKDMTYVSAIAARGANEVRTLFVYNKVNDRLTHIKNSEDYPNMQYNRSLNCVDAFLVYGGCSTVFARVRRDSLVQFASVDLGDHIIIRTYDRNGKETIIRKDTLLEFEYRRYKNFQPLIEYKD